jgi:hypothetical protein
MPARFVARALAYLGNLLGDQVGGWRTEARHRLRRAWSARPTGARAGAILLALVLAGGGLAALLARLDLAGRLPSPLDWRAAGALLRRDARAGDAVVVAPAWLERAREVAPPGLPVLAPARLEEERLPAIRRVWLVSASGLLHGPSPQAQELARRASATDVRRLGALEVARYDLGSPLQPLAALADRAPPQVPVRQLDAGGVPRRCLLLEPQPEQPVTVPFGAIQLGRTLAGHALLLSGAGSAPARIAFRVDDEEVGALLLGGPGWRPFELDTSRHAPGAHAVSVMVSGSGSTGPLCLEALALP